MGNVFGFCEPEEYHKVIILGLRGTGKTTVFNYLTRRDDPAEYMSTTGYSNQKVSVENIGLDLWDVGGAAAVRPYWKHFFPDVKGVIFMVSDPRLNAEKTGCMFQAQIDEFAWTQLELYNVFRLIPKALVLIVINLRRKYPIDKEAEQDVKAKITLVMKALHLSKEELTSENLDPSFMLLAANMFFREGIFHGMQEFVRLMASKKEEEGAPVNDQIKVSNTL